jgi:hypothetical protein
VCLHVYLGVVCAARKRAILDWEVEKGRVGEKADDDDGDYTTFDEGTELDVSAAKASMEAAAADLARRKEALLRDLMLA